MAAGITDKNPKSAESDGNPKEFDSWADENSSVVREDPTPYNVRKHEESGAESLEERVERLEDVIISLADLIKIRRMKP